MRLSSLPNPSHAQYATCLFGLASGLFRRGELRGTLLDFDEAAVLSGQVVETTPPGHTYRAMRLTLHAQALCYLVGLEYMIVAVTCVFS